MVTVKFKKIWRGHVAGAVVDLTDERAAELIGLKICAVNIPTVVESSLPETAIGVDAMSVPKEQTYPRRRRRTRQAKE